MKSSFLNEDLVKEISIIPVPGIGLDGKISALKNACHCHEQAPLAWFEKLLEALVKLGFISLTFDPFVHIIGNHNMIIVVNVADNTTARSRSDIYPLFDHLRSRF